MSYYLFLDDIRQPEEAFSYTKNLLYLNKKWLVVKSYDEFIKCIEENGVPHTISMDHDLSYDHYNHQEFINYDEVEKTGYHCAVWLIEYCMDNQLQIPSGVLIHSMNPVGSENIRSVFHTYNKYLSS